jgi:hypothetical protein
LSPTLTSTWTWMRLIGLRSSFSSIIIDQSKVNWWSTSTTITICRQPHPHRQPARQIQCLSAFVDVLSLILES